MEPKVNSIRLDCPDCSYMLIQNNQVCFRGNNPDCKTCGNTNFILDGLIKLVEVKPVETVNA